MTRRPPPRDRDRPTQRPRGAATPRAVGTAVAVAATLVALVVVAGAVGPATALGGGMHGTHVDVDPQVTSDGTVVVETLSMLRPGFVVLRADDGGSPGEPVGHAAVRGVGYQSDISVTVDPVAWSEWSGNRTLWAVLHRTDGDGRFEPASDPAVTARNPAARTQFTVRKTANGSARVVGTGREARPLSDGAVTVPRVALPAPGHLVVEATDGGETVGATALAAGRHENVTVALNDSFLADRPDRFRVRAVVYRDDGDGSLDADDRPVTAGGEAVSTVVVVEKGDDGGVVIITPEPTGTEPRDSDGSDASGGTTTERPSTGGSGETATASAGGPGPGALGALAALVLLAGALVADQRKRRERRD